MSSEENEIKVKGEKDFEPYRRGLEGWMKNVIPEKSGAFRSRPRHSAGQWSLE